MITGNDKYVANKIFLLFKKFYRSFKIKAKIILISVLEVNVEAHVEINV